MVVSLNIKLGARFIIFVSLIIGIAGCQLSGDATVVSEINNLGAAVTKPLPDVAVFVAQAGGRERLFSDDQLMSLIPLLNRLEKFERLDLTGTSVTDASVIRLKDVHDLRGVNLSKTKVSVRGIGSLTSGSSLRVVWIAEHQFATDDIETLRRSSYPTVIKILSR